MLLFLFHVTLSFHCSHTVHGKSGVHNLSKKEWPFEVFVFVQLQHHPIFMQINFIMRTSLSTFVFLQTAKKPRRAHMISKNKPFNDAPSEPARLFVNVSGVIVWRECDRSSTSINAYFPI